MTSLEVLFAPAEFTALRSQDLSDAVCVVFDVLRATSTMVTALANGAAAIVPVEEIAEALAVRAAHPHVLLAGERHGLRIGASLTGGVGFDLGNSPREFRPEFVAGRTIAMTTTNGTRALWACAHARSVYIGSFLNLRATAEAVAAASGSARVILVCGGTGEHTAYEDALGAGALCDLLSAAGDAPDMTDSALMARQLYRDIAGDLAAAFARAWNGRRLLTIAELRDDVAYCAQRDVANFAAGMDLSGRVRKA